MVQWEGYIFPPILSIELGLNKFTLSTTINPILLRCMFIIYITWLDFWATRRVRITSNGYDDNVAKNVAVTPHMKCVLDVLFNSSLLVDRHARDFWNTTNWNNKLGIYMLIKLWILCKKKYSYMFYLCI